MKKNKINDDPKNELWKKNTSHTAYVKWNTQEKYGEEPIKIIRSFKR